MRSPSAFAARTPVRHPGRSSFIFLTIPWSRDMKTQSFAIPAASTISTTFSSRRTSWPYCFSSTTTLHRPLQTASASASVGTRSAANCAPTRLPMSTERIRAASVCQIFIGSPAAFIRSLSWTTRTSPSADSWTSSST